MGVLDEPQTVDVLMDGEGLRAVAEKFVGTVYNQDDVKHKNTKKSAPRGDGTSTKRPRKTKAKVETLECTLCEPAAQIPRDEFVQHVATHGELE